MKDIREGNDETVNVQRPWTYDLLAYGCCGFPALAVCYDCLCLISLLQTMLYLSYDWDGAFDWIGHDEGYDAISNRDQRTRLELDA